MRRIRVYKPAPTLAIVCLLQYVTYIGATCFDEQVVVIIIIIIRDDDDDDDLFIETCWSYVSNIL
jgi:hypothetical protein